MPLGGALHLRPLSSQALQRLYETDVENRQEQQRQDQHEDHVQDVVVDDDVQSVLSEYGLHRLEVRRTVRSVHVLRVQFGEAGDVVQYREYQYHGELKLRLANGTESCRLVRLTDGDVAIDADKYRHPHGGRLADGGQRKYVHGDEVVTMTEVGRVDPGVADEWREAVERKHGDEQ